MQDYLLQVSVSFIASFMASLLLALLAWLTRRAWLYGFRSDIAKVYRNNRNGLKAINHDINQSKTIKILTLRGMSFVDKQLYPQLWADLTKNKSVVFITSEIDNTAVIQERANLLGTSPEEYILDINQVIDKMKIYRKERPKLRIMQHKQGSPFQLIILDEFVYVSYYWTINGKQKERNNVNYSQMIKYKSETGAYDAFSQYFEEIQKNSKDVP